MVEEYLEQMAYSLSLYRKNAISWLEQKELESTFVVMPRTVSEVLGEKVFSKPIPFIFSSATLSEKGSFDYLAKSLGIRDYLSLTVDSPYDYEEQMNVYIHRIADAEKKGSAAVGSMREEGEEPSSCSRHLKNWRRLNSSSPGRTFRSPYILKETKKSVRSSKNFRT